MAHPRTFDTPVASPLVADAAPQRPYRIWTAGAPVAGRPGEQIIPIRHSYHLHPLMQLDALERLAHALLPMQGCKFLLGETKADSAFAHRSQAPDGKSIAEVFSRIEETGSWIALYDVGRIPEYRRFLEEAIDTARPLTSPGEVVTDVKGFIFISAPPSITPFHIDRENNFWMQIRGRKTIEVWDSADRVAVPASAVDRFIVSGSLEDVRLTDENAGRSHRFECGPGDGVYFPSTAPHLTRTDTSWVKPGDGVSISIGTVFYTNRTRRRAYVHAANHLLRRRGIAAAEAGASRVGDALKFAMGRAYVGAAKLLGRYEPPTGF